MHQENKIFRPDFGSCAPGFVRDSGSGIGRGTSGQAGFLRGRFSGQMASAVAGGWVGPPAQLALTFVTKLSNIVAK